MKKTLFDGFILSITGDETDHLAQIGDAALSIFTNECLPQLNIPFISTVISAYKIGTTIVERNHIRNLCLFIEKINKRITDESERDEYISKLNCMSEADRNKELEFVVLITSKYISEDKPKMLADLYIAYINQAITWKEFASYSEILDRFLPGDVETLLSGEQICVSDQIVSDSLLRLVAMGLLVAQSKDVVAENTLGHIHIPANSEKDYVLTDFGRKLINCIKPEHEHAAETQE